VKTVRFHSTGSPDVLTFEDVPDPVPGRGEVLIRVEAVGLNFADVLRRRGDPYPEPSPLPFTLGGEVAGTIAALGEGLTEPAIGTLVYAACRTGGYAQYVVVPVATIVPIPSGLTAAQATALVIQGLTAAFTLRDAGRLVKGETVLIEAAAGGVGSFAVQLARLFGAGRVIAAASTPEKRALAISLGADDAIDYTDAEWPDRVRDMTDGRGVDIVLEMTGGATLTRALDTLAPFGRMVVYGLASAETILIDPQRLTGPNQSVTGFYVGAYFKEPERVQAMLAEIVGYVTTGQLKLQIGATLPLSRAADAHRLLEGRTSTGKVVLEPWADA